ncbi:ATP-binding protein [Halomicrobium salinisoli]|uniref:ATP-binding protein n=1 Tax=Halomicrobium salinisoli TaxID=2878391 RepID=UPI001CF047F4|nr:PAS domain-containing sensor histidine kinase [Halomicrobium salinisoli]
MADYPPSVYESVFYAIQNPALIIDYEFEIRDTNPAAVEFLNYESRSQLLGTPVTDVLLDEAILEDVADRVRRDERWSGECELVTSDDRVLYGSGSAVPIDVDGAPPLICGLFTDLTQRRRYTRSLRVLNRVLRHNIRNEVNVMYGHVERIAAQVEDEAAVDALRDGLEGLVDRADVARELDLLTTEKADGIVSTLRLDRHLDSAVASAEADFPEATFVYEGFEPVEVVADETVTRVVSEVLKNAVDHNDGDPHVRVSLSVDEETAVVSVADDGPGVPPERRDRIFGREEVDQLHHGNGLGLFFVDQMMDVYGGDVRVEDGPDGGAVFRLSFSRDRS